MNTHLLSIIIPVYNVENVLERCLDSVLSQTFTNFQVILVNDGSRDNSGAICRNYAERDKRFMFIDQANSGVSYSRNIGLELATGEYVVFIDSDDYISPEFLQTYIDVLVEYPQSLIYQGLINEYEDKNDLLVLPKGKYFDQEICDALYEVELRQCLGGACNKVFKMSVINSKNIRFRPQFSFGEDKIFTLEYCKNINSIILLDTCYYHYNRTQENSLSKKHHKAKELEVFLDLEYKFFSEILKKYPSKKLREAVNGRFLSFSKYILLSMYRPMENISRKERKEAALKIQLFVEENVSDIKFEREVPAIVNKFYNNDFLMLLLMKLRDKLSSIYLVVRKFL